MPMINEVLHWNGTHYRVVAREEADIYLFDIDSKDYTPKAFLSAELEEALKEKKAKRVADPYLELREKQVCGKALIKLESNFSLIEPLIANSQALLGKHFRKLLQARAKETGTTLIKLYRLIRDWWKKGMSKQALNPEYGKKKGKRRDTENKSGPKRNTEVLPVNDAMRQAFDKACRKYLLVAVPVSIERAYEHFLYDYQKTHPELKKEQLPTRGQFEYYYRSQFDAGTRNRMRNTPAHYQKDIRALTGNTYDVVSKVGEVWEVDATLADIYLVSEEDRMKIVGRPTLYSVTDSFSGMIVGVAVSLDPASYKGAADALYNAVSPKKEFCERLGVSLCEGEWDTEGLPAMIVFDNAELSGPRIELFASANNITLSNTASYRGDQKGLVESSLGQIQGLLKELPGKPDKITLKKAGGKDRRPEAALTLSEYRKCVVEAVLAANRRLRRCTPPGWPSSVAPVPVEIWRRSAAAGKSVLRAVEDKVKLRLSLLPQHPVTVSRDGLCYKGIRWMCSKARDKGLFDRITESARPKSMMMVIDPASVNRAWLLPHPETNPYEFWECELAPLSKHLEDMTLAHAVLYVEAASKTNAQAKREAQLCSSEHLAKIEATKKEALRQKTKARLLKGKVSKAEQVREIGANKRSERVLQEIKHPRVEEKTKTQTQEEPKKPKPSYAYPTDPSKICD